MVISLFAMTAAFAGSAAAQSAGEFDLEDENDKQNLSGSLFWQGQEFTIDGLEENDNVQIRRVTETGSDFSSSLVRERTVGPGGNLTVDTSGLDADDYIFRINGDDLRADDNAVPGTGDRVVWEVAIQSLDAEFDDTTVSDGDTTTLEIESNRGNLEIEVSADGLDFEDLEDIFAGSHAADHDAEEDDDIIILEAGGDVELDATFTDIDAGDYTFEIEVVDTDAEATAYITVREEDVGIDFPESVYSQEAGDIAEITIELEDTDTAYLFIGGDDSGFLVAAEILDDEEEGEVTVLFNTWLAGQTDDAIDLFDAEDDAVIVDAWNSTDLDGEAGGFEGIDVGHNFSEPIEAGDYDLRLASSLDIDEDGELEDETDVATLILEDRSTDDLSLGTAPSASADEDDEVDDLLDVTTETDTVAIDDRLVITVEAPPTRSGARIGPNRIRGFTFYFFTN